MGVNNDRSGNLIKTSAVVVWRKCQPLSLSLVTHTHDATIFAHATSDGIVRRDAMGNT